MAVGAFERLITRLSSMKREELILLLSGMQCTFPLDFTEDYLQSVSVERLRHIVLAASVHQAEVCA